MRDENRCIDMNGARGTLLGAAVVAFGVIAVGAYSFAASGDQSRPVAAQEVSTREIRTTPDNAGQHEMPPPVAPSKTE
jgi:hypothetical protein